MAPHPSSLTADQLARRREVTLIKRCLAFTAFFMLAELVIGYQFHVLSLVADSYHMMNDVVAFVVQLYADNLGNLERKHGREGTAFSFGFGRVEFLASLIQGSILFALCLTLALESMQRCYSVQTMSLPPVVVAMGVLGMLWNLVVFRLFETTHDHAHGHDVPHTSHALAHPGMWRKALMHSAVEAPLRLAASTSSRQSYVARSLSHDKHHENEHSHGHDYVKQKASLKGFFNPQSSLADHAFADAMGSAVVIVDGVATWLFGPPQGKVSGVVRYWEGVSYVDPLCSLAVVYLILTHSVPLVTKSSYALMHAFDPLKSGKIKKMLRSGRWLPLQLVGKVQVHLTDLKIWSLTEKSRFVTVHLEVYSLHGEHVSVTEIAELEKAAKRVLQEVAPPEQVTVEVHIASSHSQSPHRPTAFRSSSNLSSRSSSQPSRTLPPPPPIQPRPHSHSYSHSHTHDVDPHSRGHELGNGQDSHLHE
ncbi:hypothetical protein JCM11251_001784 [Rhodosporidiobolus azoricus]